MRRAIERGLAMIVAANVALAQQPVVERATLTTTGVESHGLVDSPAISADGRFVAYSSDASDLVQNDTNQVADVFVHDRLLGTTERVSLSNTPGVESNGASDHAGISSDGRYVAFTSAATNLTNNPDFNGGLDVFVHDRTTHLTRLVSVAALSQPTGGMTAAGGSFSPAITANGRWVVFYSGAFDLLAPGVDTNGKVDAFVADLVAGTMVRISVDSAGAEADWHSGVSPAIPGGTGISDDGRFAVFTSGADNLVPGAISGLDTVYVRDLALGTTDVVAFVAPGQPSLQESSYPAISADGRFVVFYSRDPALVPGDTNASADAFVRDLVLGTTERVSLDSLGAQGTYTGPLQVVLVGKPSISATGRFVAFETLFQNLVPGDTNVKTDVFVHDRVTGVTQLVSRSLSGVGGNSGSYRPALSGNGDVVAFQSDANNLVALDLNAKPDIFVASVPVSAVGYCSGDGSAAPCPCGNFGASGRGCANSVVASGARLTATGGSSVGSDTFSLIVTGLPPSTIVALYQGTTQHLGGTGAPFGDGLRCVAGTLVRLGTQTAGANGGLVYGYSVAGDPHLGAQGQIGATGGVRTYQAYYRNTTPFCTAGTFNLSNGLEIGWVP